MEFGAPFRLSLSLVDLVNVFSRLSSANLGVKFLVPWLEQKRNDNIGMRSYYASIFLLPELLRDLLIDVEGAEIRHSCVSYRLKDFLSTAPAGDDNAWLMANGVDGQHTDQGVKRQQHQWENDENT